MTMMGVATGMRSAHGIIVGATLALGTFGGVALAQTPPLFQEVATLSSDVVPIETDFTIPQSGAGQYQITLTDLGALIPDPPGGPGAAPLESVHVLITRGATAVVSLDGADDVAPVDTKVFDAEAGASYVVHVVGKPGQQLGSGPFSLRIATVSNDTPVLTFSGTLSPPQTPQDGVRTFQREFDIAADGSYQVSLTDLAFPQALETAGLFLFKPGATSLAACVSIPAIPTVCPGSPQTVTLTAGHYQLVAAGALATGTEAGVFSVDVRPTGGGAAVASEALEIGRVKRISPLAFQLDAGGHTLKLTDLEFPAALAQRSALVTSAAQVVAVADANNPQVSFNVATNDTDFDVFTYAVPDTTAGAGSYSIEVRPDSGPVALSSVEVEASPSAGTAAYAFSGDITTAGAYRARLGDFQFPAALSSARLAIVQNGVLVGKTDVGNPGPTLSLDLANLAVGSVTALAVVRPASTSGTLEQASGTFGIDLIANGATQAIIDATQGVGGLISVRKVSITQPGRYDITVSDLDFPDPFQELMAVVSRGAERLGTLIVESAGSSSQAASATLQDFEATTAGNYSLTFIARPDATKGAATYGLSVIESPPAPTVTLSVTPNSVPNGQRASLTWSTQNSASCTASSNPSGVWTGTKAASGTEASGVITGATAFTLRCTSADGRSTEKSVNVTLEPERSRSGGGGALDELVLLLLLAASTLRARRRA